MPPLPSPPPSTLLILHIPPPPPTSSHKTITTYYLPPIESTLKSLQTSTLTIALSAPFLAPGLSTSRAKTCDWAQKILTGVYSLASRCLMKEGKVEGKGGVDVTVVFYYDGEEDGVRNGSGDGDENSACKWRWQLGPIFSVQNILGDRVRRRWKEVVYVGGGKEEGEGAKRKRPSWVDGHDGAGGVERVVEYSPPSSGAADGDIGNAVERKEGEDGVKHEIVAVGGTFDHLHAGHKLLLTTTAFLVDPPLSPQSPPPKLVIGLTGPKLLLNKKHSEFLQPWSSRAHDTLTFLTSILTFSPSAAITSNSTTTQSSTSIPIPPSPVLDETKNQSPMVYVSTLTVPGEGEIVIEIVEINDPCGPTITEEAISALVVSEETRAGGPMVNEKRREKGWKELEVFVVGVVMEGGDGEGNEEKMSSTEIRRRQTALGKI